MGRSQRGEKFKIKHEQPKNKTRKLDLLLPEEEEDRGPICDLSLDPEKAASVNDEAEASIIGPWYNLCIKSLKVEKEGPMLILPYWPRL